MTSRVLPVAIGLVLAQALLLAWTPGDWAIFILYAGCFLLGALWAVGQVLRPELVFFRWPMLAPAIPALVGLLQLATGQTVYSWATWRSIAGWLANTVLLFVAAQCFRRDRMITRWLRWFGPLGFALCALCVLQLYTSDGLVFWRWHTVRDTWVMGNLSYKNHYAAFVELLFPVLVWLAARSQRPFVYITLAALAAGSTVAALSRGGVLIVAAEFAICAMVLIRRNFVASGALTAAVAGFVVVLALAIGAFGWERFEQKLASDGDRRLLINQSSLAMAADRPLLGFGMGTWTTVYPAYARYDAGLFVNAAHNDWLEWLDDGGPLVVAAMLWLAFSIAVPSLRSIWGLGALALLVHAVVDFPLRLPALATVFYTLVAALLAESATRPRDESGSRS